MLAELRTAPERKPGSSDGDAGVGKELRPAGRVDGGLSVLGGLGCKIFGSLLCCSSQARAL